MKFVFPLSLTLFLSGCTQYATIHALKPSESPKTATFKTYAIQMIEQDTIGLVHHLQIALSNNGGYFTLVSPNGAPHGLIRGALTSKSIDLTPYNEERTECLDKECRKVRKYLLTCINKHSSLHASLQVVAPKNHEVLFASGEYAMMDENHCPDDNIPITSDENHYTQLSQKIAHQFVSRLTPSYEAYEVPFIDEPDISYTPEQKELLANGLELIDENRIDKAISRFEELVLLTHNKSYVALYNLGVGYEMGGRLDEARHHYRMADTLIPVSNTLINTALNRIEKSIYDFNTVSKQTNK